MGDDPKADHLDDLSAEPQKPSAILIAIAIVFGLFIAYKVSEHSRSAAGIGEYSEVRRQGVIHLVVTQTTDMYDLKYMAKWICADQPVCSVQFWPDRRDVPDDLMRITPAQVESRVATYWFNKSSGLEQIMPK